MAEEAVEVEETKKGKGKLIIIIVVVLVLLGGGGAAAFFMMGGEEAPAAEQTVAAEGEGGADGEAEGPQALYVPMGKPFLLNLKGKDRERMVEIKVELMVRGIADDVLVRKHIPLIEDKLLTVLSGADVEQLKTPEGKNEQRRIALENVQQVLQSVAGRTVVEQVLFTGFIMQ